MDLRNLKQTKPLTSLVESLLFISPNPVSISQIASALDESDKNVKKALDELSNHYKEYHCLSLQWHQNRVQLTTHPDISEIIEKFLDIEITTNLSQASLEALAIIAYKQPITRPEIDDIRGVNSDGVVRNLLSKGLIEETGRQEGAGRPILYSTTADFLSYFGLTSLDELPAFDVLPLSQDGGTGILKD